MRRPYRERSEPIVSGLGAGVAGNGQDLNDTIRRAVPALRETDKRPGAPGQAEHRHP